MARYFVTIRASDERRLRDLRDVYQADVFIKTAKQAAPGSYQVEGLLSDEEIDRLRASGYEIEVGANAEEVAREKRGEAGARPPFE